MVVCEHTRICVLESSRISGAGPPPTLELALPYLVDGNNLAGTGSASGRRGVVDLIRRHTLSRGGRYTIIFDGPPDDHFVGDLDLGAVKIRFSGSRSADEIIRQSLRATKNPRNLTVVTSDRSLASSCRSLGARVMGCGEFQGMLKSSPATEGAQKERPANVDVAFWEDFFAGPDGGE